MTQLSLSLAAGRARRDAGIARTMDAEGCLMRDVRALPYMPLFVGQLLASDTWLLATGDQAKAAVTLWARSWHQVPAGSLPNDERVLAALSGAGGKWRNVREVALRGFVVGEDGRLHHALIEAAADDALGKMDGQRTRTAAATAARQAQRQKLREEQRHVERNVQRDVPPDVVPDVVQREREGNVTEQKEVPTPTAPEPPNPNVKTVAATAKKPRPTAPLSDERQAQARAVWQAYSDAYRDRYGVEPLRGPKENAQVRKLLETLPADEAPEVAACYVRNRSAFYVTKGHPIGLLVADAVKLRTEWFTGRSITQTEARQGDRTAATGNVFNALRSEARNGTEG